MIARQQLLHSPNQVKVNWANNKARDCVSYVSSAFFHCGLRQHISIISSRPLHTKYRDALALKKHDLSMHWGCNKLNNTRLGALHKAFYYCVSFQGELILEVTTAVYRRRMERETIFKRVLSGKDVRRVRAGRVGRRSRYVGCCLRHCGIFLLLGYVIRK